MLDRVFEAAQRLRRDPLPHRLSALAAGAPLRDALRDHAARPARPARPARRCTGTSPSIRWCRSPTASASRCRRPTGAPPSTTGCRATCTASMPEPQDYFAFVGRISPEKRVDRAIEIAHRLRHAAAHRGQGRPGRPGLLRADDRAAARPSAGRVRRRDRRRTARTTSSATRARCCSRSTGPSRSAS